MYAVDPARRTELQNAISEAAAKLEVCEQEAAALADEDRELRKIRNGFQEKSVRRSFRSESVIAADCLVRLPSKHAGRRSSTTTRRSPP